MGEAMMHESDFLALETAGLPRRTAAGMRALTEGCVRAAARALEAAAFGTIWLLLPVWPAVAAALTRDGDDLRCYRTTLGRVARHIRAQWRSHSLARMLVQRLTPPVLRRPQRVHGSCTHCGRCCLDRACLFLAFEAEGRSSCRIYGGRLWQSLSCGQYPGGAEDIALYGCPSFTTEPEARTRPVIRVVPATRAAASQAVNEEIVEATASRRA